MIPAYRSDSISIGSLRLGGNEPVRIQSMTNTDTNNIDASVDQCIRMINAGAHMVRLTTQGSREVKSLVKIKESLHSLGYNTPVVADIHFKPGLAREAARVADKIRINPGNYLKGGSVDTLLPDLIHTCKQHNTSVRIGVNHGSLNESVLHEFGDTPAGMVWSAMEFLRICKREGFENVVVSLKSSNPRVMIQSVRLLTRTMSVEGMSYPLHLGVTEAGDGIEGRIKSVTGMAPLLLEGMGDTIRVSLTEPPEAEIPVANMIAGLFPKPRELPYDPFDLPWNPFDFGRRISTGISGMGNGSKVKIISPVPPEPGADLHPGAAGPAAVSFKRWKQKPQLLDNSDHFLLLDREDHSLQMIKSFLADFCSYNHSSPVVYRFLSMTEDSELFRMQTAGELGSLLVDGVLDGIWVENPHMTTDFINETLLMILQAAGARISKTEYIACPSCGRTHFDIMARLNEIKMATSHLKALKIGVMGCMVNGPGEMADADYGYVGAGPGKVSLYKGKVLKYKNVPEQEALDLMVDLIKSEGDWIDPTT